MNDVLSRRKMLGMIGVAGVAVAGCQIKPKQGTESSPTLVIGKSETGLALADEAFSHTLEGHPENALRLKVIKHSLLSAQGNGRFPPLFSIPSRTATIEELRLVHEPDYIDKIQRALTVGEFLTKSKWSPYGGPAAFTAAASSVAASIDLVRAIYEKRIRNGFAIVRPPGHHAGANQAAGYCIFNNTAVAVRSLQKTQKCRVAIVDFDQHHGSGIEEVFYLDENVLYVSTHQDDWPHTGKIDRIGEGAAKGTNVNIPLPYGTGDSGLAKVYDEVVVPLLHRFKPDIIVVAAGFDTHWRDYQGSFILSLSGISEISRKIKQAAEVLCGGRVAYVLEGGYQLSVLAAGVSNIVGDLCGSVKPVIDPYGASVDKEASVASVISKVRKIHRL